MNQYGKSWVGVTFVASLRILDLRIPASSKKLVYGSATLLRQATQVCHYFSGVIPSYQVEAREFLHQLSPSKLFRDFTPSYEKCIL